MSEWKRPIKSTAADVSSNFIDELLIHFPRRDLEEEDDVKWAQSMTRNLEGFPPDVLVRAAQIIIDTAGYKNGQREFHWLPKECKEACLKAERAIADEKPKFKFTGKPDGQKVEDTHDYRERLALELILGPMGRRAAREGWILGLFNFIKDKMRLPSETEHCGDKRKMHKEHGPVSEVECLKIGAAGVMTTLENLYRNEYDINPAKKKDWEEQRVQLISMGEKMLRDRQKYKNYVETGVLP